MAETWLWIEANGIDSWILTNFDNQMEVTPGVVGRGIPPIRRTRVTAAGQPGSQLQEVEHDMRTLQLPLLLRSDSEVGRAGLIEGFSHGLDPERGVGRLQLTLPSGGILQVNALYAGGLEVDEGESNRFPGCQAAVLTFECDDPYWYEADDSLAQVVQSQSFGSSGTPVPWFSDPTKSILPVSLSSSAILGTATLSADGTVPTWPTWTVDGPGTDLVIRNATSGREFRWAGTLAEGQQLIIDTRPGVKSVLSDAGLNLFGGLTSWDLWPLLAGDNDLEITMAETDGSSQVTVSYVNRFLTA